MLSNFREVVLIPGRLAGFIAQVRPYVQLVAVLEASAGPRELLTKRHAYVQFIG